MKRRNDPILHALWHLSRRRCVRLKETAHLTVMFQICKVSKRQRLSVKMNMTHEEFITLKSFIPYMDKHMT